MNNAPFIFLKVLFADLILYLRMGINGHDWLYWWSKVIMSFITLLTDFGIRDGAVGLMKGVIWRIAPEAKIADLSHTVAPQNLQEAAVVLRFGASYFPPGTIHIVVVDPGVGTHRRPIAARLGEVWVRVRGVEIEGMVRTFGERPLGSLIALYGTEHDLNISVVNGNAAKQLGAKVGDVVEVNGR